MRLQPVHGGRRLLTQVLSFSCVVSPATVGEVDWTVHYPAYVAKDGETARNGGITQYVVCNCSSGPVPFDRATHVHWFTDQWSFWT